MMDWWHLHGNQVISTLVFSAIGMGTFALFFLVLPHILPFSLKKEMEEDQNTALGIVLGALVIGIALIISAAISGGG
jgi:uncharacterized membrane protein YjfL (UPF0719 family)